MKVSFIKVLFLINILLFPIAGANGQIADSVTFRINTRMDFYSWEKNGEFLLLVPEHFRGRHLSVEIFHDQEKLSSWQGVSSGSILRLPFLINLISSTCKIKASIKCTEIQGTTYQANTIVRILTYKSNEVKTDRLTGGLLVNKLPFFPFGFYCYSPVPASLPEEEAVRGFNMISPYQKIDPATITDRKSYMDRCAQLGMKVHYNLLSVSGGGGVGASTDKIDAAEKKKRLIEEIRNFMDHPALLAWYISDEPNGRKVDPEELKEIYRTIKETDPWHPVSIVFMTPFTDAKKYSEAMDIVMADPYPVPDHPLSMAGEAAAKLRNEFIGVKPVWIVPQAFGGGELWSREPTIREIRSMTWQSIINGASGIQYFVRQGPNYFPKSTAAWSECGEISVEVAELTPWLLSDEQAPSVFSSTSNVTVTSRIHDGQVVIIAANKLNEPVTCYFRINGSTSGQARVLFENRMISFSSGTIRDQISALGTQVYLIDKNRPKDQETSSANNLIKDPGFEDLSSPGLPASCYARPGGDRGATFFLDSRDFSEGNHSLRIITPQEDKGLSIRFFPITVGAGKSYTISVWAKSDPEQRIFSETKNENKRLYDKNESPQYVEILFGEFGKARFVPSNRWREYMTFVTIPSDTLAHFKTNLVLKMPGQGVAWFDQVTVTEDMEK